MNKIMITEDYCSYEVAKLLKEKGFDKFNTYGWNEQLFDKEHPRNFSIGFDNKEHWISCPTHHMAMKWLKEEKNILIYVYPVIDLPVKNYTLYWRWDGKKKRHDAPYIGDKHNYESFKQAVEAALKYSLENLI